VSKVIISPIERYKGSVTIADPLTIPQAQAVEAGFELDSEFVMEARRAFLRSVKENGENVKETSDLKTNLITAILAEKKNPFFSESDKMQSPAILVCVEKWNLENFSLTNDGQLPASPRKDTHKLIEWIYSEIRKVYFGELDIPNESSPTPSVMPEATDEAQS